MRDLGECMLPDERVVLKPLSTQRRLQGFSIETERNVWNCSDNLRHSHRFIIYPCWCNISAPKVPPSKLHPLQHHSSSAWFLFFYFFKLIRLCTFWNSGWSFLWMISKQHWGGEVLIAWVPISFCFTQTIQLRSTTDKYFLLSKTAALLWMVKLNCFLLAPLYNLEDSILFFSPS